MVRLPISGMGCREVSLNYHQIPILSEPHHEKTCLLPYANNKGIEQHPAYPHSLISSFVVLCLGSMITKVTVCTKPGLVRLHLVRLSRLVWVLPGCTTPKTGFLMMWLIILLYWSVLRLLMRLLFTLKRLVLKVVTWMDDCCVFIKIKFCGFLCFSSDFITIAVQLVQLWKNFSALNCQGSNLHKLFSIIW